LCFGRAPQLVSNKGGQKHLEGVVKIREIFFQRQPHIPRKNSGSVRSFLFLQRVRHVEKEGWTNFAGNGKNRVPVWASRQELLGEKKGVINPCTKGMGRPSRNMTTREATAGPGKKRSPDCVLEGSATGTAPDHNFKLGGGGQ